jgi:hypothetical protein
MKSSKWATRWARSQLIMDVALTRALPLGPQFCDSVESAVAVVLSEAVADDVFAKDLLVEDGVATTRVTVLVVELPHAFSAIVNGAAATIRIRTRLLTNITPSAPVSAIARLIAYRWRALGLTPLVIGQAGLGRCSLSAPRDLPGRPATLLSS